MRRCTSISAVLALGALAACSQGDEAPETFTGSAEVGRECVEAAAKTYGVTLDYINLNPMIRDPSGGYAYAYPGTATQSSGTSKSFLCRLDENKAFADIATVLSGS
jgi:hypothetical protein